MELFRRLCGRFPEIRSGYLRHSLVFGSWTAGLSDIDYTIILNDDLSAEQDFGFYKEFFKSYMWIKSFLPMLGEVEVMSEEDFNVWVKFGLRGKMSKFWALIHGHEIRCNDEIVLEPTLIDLLEEAFGLYEYYLIPKLKEESSWLNNLEIERISGKICKQLEHKSNAKSLNDVICTLDESCKRFIKDNPDISESARYDVRFEKISVPYDISQTRDGFAVSEDIIDILHIRLSDVYGITLVMVKAGTSANILFERLKHKNILIMTESMLEYYFRVHHPELFPYLCDRCESIKGDSLPSLLPPSSKALEESVISNAVRSSVFYHSYIRKVETDVYSTYLLSYISTLKYLKTGVLSVGDLEEIAQGFDKELYDGYFRLYKNKSEDTLQRHTLMRRIVKRALSEIRQMKNIA